ncbi:MAG: hypothetical protein GC189_09560 [Alphaproteobacteria bacterium]|nr:hypothetical protein [Alphaproteobacteria bacterium]
MSMLDAQKRAALGRAALQAAAAKPWRDVTLFDLADAAGAPAQDLYPASMADAADAAEEFFDRAMAADMRGVDAEQSVRDRLFDCIMRRFEAMEPHRAAIAAMEVGQDRDPTALAAAHQRHVRAAKWALTLCGLDADYMSGQARAQGLAVIIGQARLAWRGDDAGDFAKTMASLDKNLRRAEEMFGRFAGFGAKKTDEPPAEQT